MVTRILDITGKFLINLYIVLLAMKNLWHCNITIYYIYDETKEPARK